MSPTGHELDPDFAAAVSESEALGVPGWAALSVGSGRRVEADLFGGGAGGAETADDAFEGTAAAIRSAFDG